MTKIEKLFVIVAEEDYRYSLSDWDGHIMTMKKKKQIVDDARDPEQSLIFNQEWIIEDGDYSLYESLNELLGRECKIITRILIWCD